MRSCSGFILAPILITVHLVKCAGSIPHGFLHCSLLPSLLTLHLVNALSARPAPIILSYLISGAMPLHLQWQLLSTSHLFALRACLAVSRLCSTPSPLSLRLCSGWLLSISHLLALLSPPPSLNSTILNTYSMRCYLVFPRPRLLWHTLTSGSALFGFFLTPQEHPPIHQALGTCSSISSRAPACCGRHLQKLVLYMVSKQSGPAPHVFYICFNIAGAAAQGRQRQRYRSCTACTVMALLLKWAYQGRYLFVTHASAVARVLVCSCSGFILAPILITLHLGKSAGSVPHGFLALLSRSLSLDTAFCNCIKTQDQRQPFHLISGAMPLHF